MDITELVWLFIYALSLACSFTCVCMDANLLRQQKGEGWWFRFAKVIHFSIFLLLFGFSFHLSVCCCKPVIYSIHLRLIRFIFPEKSTQMSLTLVIEYATIFFMQNVIRVLFRRKLTLFRWKRITTIWNPNQICPINFSNSQRERK